MAVAGSSPGMRWGMGPGDSRTASSAMRLRRLKGEGWEGLSAVPAAGNLSAAVMKGGGGCVMESAPWAGGRGGPDTGVVWPGCIVDTRMEEEKRSQGRAGPMAACPRAPSLKYSTMRRMV